MAVPAGSAFADVNASPVSVPWSFVDKWGFTSPQAGEFLRAGLDLTAVYGPNVPRFVSFLAETRSSPSTTATLSDLALGALNRIGTPYTVQPGPYSNKVTVTGFDTGLHAPVTATGTNYHYGVTGQTQVVSAASVSRPLVVSSALGAGSPTADNAPAVQPNSVSPSSAGEGLATVSPSVTPMLTASVTQAPPVGMAPTPAAPPVASISSGASTAAPTIRFGQVVMGPAASPVGIAPLAPNTGTASSVGSAVTPAPQPAPASRRTSVNVAIAHDGGRVSWAVYMSDDLDRIDEALAGLGLGVGELDDAEGALLTGSLFGQREPARPGGLRPRGPGRSGVDRRAAGSPVGGTITGR